MEKVKLIEICTPKQWKTLATSELKANGKYLVYGANGVIGYYDNYNHEKETVLITCRGATCGNVHISREKSYINGNAMALDNLNEQVCLKEYLYYFLKQYDMKKVISGSAQPQITVQSLKNIDVKITDVETQTKIVKELNIIQQIIDIRKKQIEDLRELIKAKFVHMIQCDKYDKKCLNDISEIKGEYGSGASAREYIEGQPRYVRITDIQEDGRLNYNNMASPKNENNLEKYTLGYGDILFARTGATVGKTYKYSENDGFCIYAGYCIRFRLDLEKANPDYIFSFTKTEEYKKWVENKQRIVAQPNINAKEYGNDLLIPIPPIELQNQFAEFVNLINKHIDKIQKSLEEMQKLQESLMNKYFN